MLRPKLSETASYGWLYPIEISLKSHKFPWIPDSCGLNQVNSIVNPHWMFRCLAFTTVTPKALASPNRRSGVQDAGPWGQQLCFCLKCSSLHQIIAILGSWILNFNLLSVVRAPNYRSIDWVKDWGMALIMKNCPTLPKHSKEQHHGP